MTKKIITVIIFAIAAFSISTIFFLTGFGEHLEHKAYDLMLSNKSKYSSLSDDIVIIAIDDDSFGSFMIQWPFPREYHAHLVRNLKRLGAKQIIFDIEFSESYKESADIDLGLAAAEHGNVIFAGKIYQNFDNNYLTTTTLPPIYAIRRQSPDWGLVNMPSDKDGFVRQYSLFQRIKEDTYYSLALKSYLKLFNDPIVITESHVSVGQMNVPYFANNEVLINYYGQPKFFKHYSYSSVVDDSSFVLPMEEFFEINDFYHLLDSEAFKDKIVFIGATADELKDNFHTPVNDKNQLMAGVEIHANMLQMLLDNNFIKRIPFTIFYPISLIIILLISVFYYWLKPLSSLIYSLIFILFYLFLTYYLFLKHNILLPILVLPAMILFIYLGYLVYHYILESKEKLAIKKTFQHYMAPALVKELLKSPEKLKYGGSQQEVSVLFSDIRGFTTFSETHGVEETVSMLREYLTEMVNTIMNNQGILDKFIGDAVMALFNTPIQIENHAFMACCCAMDMVNSLHKLQDKWISEGKEAISIGIGINTGNAVVGNLGSEQIFDYTGIGDTINLGARLESINKEYQTKNGIIISEFTLEKVKDLIEYEYLDEVTVKGKTKPVKIYQLIAIKNS